MSGLIDRKNDFLVIPGSVDIPLIFVPNRADGEYNYLFENQRLEKVSAEVLLALDIAKQAGVKRIGVPQSVEGLIKLIERTSNEKRMIAVNSSFYEPSLRRFNSVYEIVEKARNPKTHIHYLFSGKGDNPQYHVLDDVTMKMMIEITQALRF